MSRELDCRGPVDEPLPGALEQLKNRHPYGSLTDFLLAGTITKLYDGVKTGIFRSIYGALTGQGPPTAVGKCSGAIFRQLAGPFTQPEKVLRKVGHTGKVEVVRWFQKDGAQFEDFHRCYAIPVLH